MSQLKLFGAFEIGLEAFICKYRQNREKFAKGVVSSANILALTHSLVDFLTFYYPSPSPTVAASHNILIFNLAEPSSLQKFKIYQNWGYFFSVSPL
jgi:hypothetical protein